MNTDGVGIEDPDGDGLDDGVEDANRDAVQNAPGGVFNETSPIDRDTDADGLCDGWCSGEGEDENNNGIRDQDANGDWNETDFPANDSDVDGVLDGDEVNGSYCFKGGSCANSAHPLDPLDADSDADGLRDGQELAGWMVGIWYERTMEKKLNYTVTSDPWDDNSDGDTLTDFSEFLNGSDPRSTDTDGDQISDTDEIALKSNITGIEGTPPQIANVSLNVGIKWDWWGFLYLPMRATVTVAFDVEDNVGIDRVEVRFIRYAGETMDTFRPGTAGCGSLQCHVQRMYEFSIFEALVAGADVNITAFDVNENGASGEFHVDSVLEAIAKAVAAFLEAIAKVIMEAASFLVGIIVAVGKAIFEPVFNILMDGIEIFARSIQDLLGDFLGAIGGHRTSHEPAEDAWAVVERLLASTIVQAFMALSFVLIALDLMMLPLQVTPIFFVKSILMDFAIAAIIGALGAGLAVGIEAISGEEGFAAGFTIILGQFATGIVLGKALLGLFSIMASPSKSGTPGGAIVWALLGIVIAAAGALNPFLSCSDQLTIALFGLGLSVFSLFKYLSSKKKPETKLLTITPAAGLASVVSAMVISGVAVAGTAFLCLTED